MNDMRGEQREDSARVDLSAFRSSLDRGRPWLVEAAWMCVQALLFGTWLPGSRWRVWLLRLFGSRVGRGVAIKPRVRVKFPWKLSVGDHSWIGECAWIDNLCDVAIGSNCCVSQGAYLCTGNHDWSDPAFALITKPVVPTEPSVFFASDSEPRGTNAFV